jgi:hypothetical protein
MKNAINGRNLPSHKQIIEHAKQLWMKNNARSQDLVGTNLPEECELKEEGFLQRAKLSLMTTKNY